MKLSPKDLEDLFPALSGKTVQLEAEIKEFFSKSIYKGQPSPFNFDGFEQLGNSPIIYAIPTGQDETPLARRIKEDDTQFIKTLAEIGKKYKIRLSLPPYIYAR